MTDADTAKVLEDAADILLIHGRSRFDARDSEGRYCVVGAVMAARGVKIPRHTSVSAACDALPHDGDGVGYFDPAVEALGRHILNSGRWHSSHPETWNDATDDDDEVRDTILLAAKAIRNGEAAS